MKKTRKINKGKLTVSDRWITYFLKNGYTYLTAANYSTAMRKSGYPETLSEEEKERVFQKWLSKKKH